MRHINARGRKVQLENSKAGHEKKQTLQGKGQNQRKQAIPGIERSNQHKQGK
jgi:hypothetical protein